MPELRDALREATNKLGVLAGNPQLIAFDAMLTSYPALTVAGAMGFGVNPTNAFAGAAATIEVIANGANVPTFTGITATGSYANTAGTVNRIEFECLPSGPGSALAFYAKIGNGGGAAPVTSVAGKTGAVLLNKGDVGLANVDNTADSAKPVSTATQSAINAITPGSIGADIAGTKILTPTPTDPGNAASNSVFLSWLIAAMRGAQATLSALGTLATKSTIVSADITDGTIVDADISSTAAISASKLTGVQPLSPTLTQIGNLTNGIPEITGSGTAASIVPSASGRAVLTGDPAAARGAIGLGALATQNTVSLNTGISGNEYLTTSATLTLGQLGGPLGTTILQLANQGGLNGAQFETSIPLVDFVFRGNPGLGYPTGGVANLRFEYRPDAVQAAGNTRECQIFFDIDPFNATYFIVGNQEARIQPRLTLANGLRVTQSGATQTASLRGSKTIGTPSTTDTITVVGAQAGDIVNVSRGKDAFVSAANTVQFDSTGLGGVVVSAIVERFT